MSKSSLERLGYAALIGALVALALAALGLMLGFDTGRTSYDLEKQENYWYAILTAFLGTTWIMYLILTPDKHRSE